MHPLPAPAWEEGGGLKISESLCWGGGGVRNFHLFWWGGGVLLRGVKFVGGGGGARNFEVKIKTA